MAREGILLGYGNPLLDICITTDDLFLQKYELKPNDAILAEKKHLPMYEEMAAHETVAYIAGGATQNTLRVAQWFLQLRHAVTVFGCISHDKFGEILENCCEESGVNVKYQYTDKDSTGTCAVVITGKDRSLCANLAAANLFTADHLELPENVALIDKAQFFYCSSYPLTVCPSGVLSLAKHSHEHNKTFTMNLSAPFLVQFFQKPMMDVMPYVDILFGNETESILLAKEHNIDTEDIKEMALKIAELPKENKSKPRIVVITQGIQPSIVAHDGKVTEYPIVAIKQEDIVDTNAAGDAFAGGFLAQLVKSKPISTCMECGHYAANVIIQHSGCTYPDKPNFI